MARIYLSPPDVRALERRLVNAAFDSNWVAPVGPDLDAFEIEVAAATGVAFGVGLASGTAALHLALKELGVTPSDSVFVSTFTFVASANAVMYLGATPVFVDCDPDSWTMSPGLVAEELAKLAARGRLPKAAVIVDLYGQCADYDALLPLFEAYDIPVVEDAAESLGATYRGAPAGSFGACSVVSFNGNKVITTSSGGMFLSNEEKLARRVRYLASQAREPLAHYEHVEVGFNYRLSNILAAFGRGQLATLSERVERRRAINAEYRLALAHIPGISFMPIAAYGEPNCWLTCILVERSVAGFNSEDLRRHLESADIEARPTWKPMHLQPLFAAAPSVDDGTSARLYRSGLCLPSGSSLTGVELERVIERILELTK